MIKLSQEDSHLIFAQCKWDVTEGFERLSNNVEEVEDLMFDIFNDVNVMFGYNVENSWML